MRPRPASARRRADSASPPRQAVAPASRPEFWRHHWSQKLQRALAPLQLRRRPWPRPPAWARQRSARQRAWPQRRAETKLRAWVQQRVWEQPERPAAPPAFARRSLSRAAGRPLVVRRPRAVAWIPSPPHIQSCNPHDQLSGKAPAEADECLQILHRLPIAAARACSPWNRRRVRSKYGETVIVGPIAQPGGTPATHWCRRIQTNSIARC